MKARLLPSSAYAILLCTILRPIATAIVLPSVGSGTLPIPQNLTGIRDPRCAFSGAWSSGHVVPKKDCYSAIDRVKINAQLHGRQKFEFFGSKGQSTTRFPHVETPGCYDVGPCAVCLVMLTDFSTDMTPNIPRLPPQPWAPNSVSDADEIYSAAKNIGTACIRNTDSYGWASIGPSQSLGVFIWASGSTLERDVSRPLGDVAPLMPGYIPSSPLPGGVTSRGRVMGFV